MTDRYPPDTIVTIESKKRNNYGRWIAEIYYEGENINQWLVDNGHAEEAKY